MEFEVIEPDSIIISGREYVYIRVNGKLKLVPRDEVEKFKKEKAE